MGGQGSPTDFLFASRCVAHVMLCARTLLWMSLFIGLCASVSAEQLTLRVRCTWGGGTATARIGSLSLSEGTLTPLGTLGNEADSPCTAMSRGEREIVILPRGEKTFDGFDYEVRAPRSAQLIFQLREATRNAPPLRTSIAVERLLDASVGEELDRSGNRWHMERVPGDRIRFSFDRDHVVYRVGEAFDVRLEAAHVTEIADSSARWNIELRRAGGEEILWSTEGDFDADAAGNSQRPFTVRHAFPDYEGAFELRIVLTPKRGRFGRLGRTAAERRIQFVTVSDRPPDAPAIDSWKLVAEFDPGQSSWWDRVSKSPPWKMWSAQSAGPLGDQPPAPLVRFDVPWWAIAPGGWQAYPLPIAAVDRPHIVELDYPSDVEQTLGMSIVEPNGAGQVAPIGVDSGFEFTPAIAPGNPQILRHRLVFYPRTKTPYLVLTNRRSNAPAVFGKIRTFQGGDRLPRTAIALLGDAHVIRRTATAYYDRPFFSENFSAAKSGDPKTNRPLDDWAFFQRGAVRTAEYLSFAGYDSAVIPAVCEGSNLYPSRLLEPATIYDNGAFSEYAYDPVRKDVLELLFRTFDREGLKLTPAIHLDMPLPELERMLLESPRGDSTGIVPIGPDGKTYAETYGTLRGAAPHYNLLDERVQRAVRAIVAEIVSRYGRHRSFGGVAIRLAGTGYAQLPDDSYPLDSATLTRFALANEQAARGLPLKDPAAAWKFLQRDARAAWLKWRTDEITKFYRDLAGDLAKTAPGTTLRICPIEPFTSNRLRSLVRPTLPEEDRVTLGFQHAGIDLAAIAAIGNVRVVHTHWEETVDRLDPTIAHWSGSPAWGDRSEHLRMRKPEPLRLEAFEKQSPFGPKNTQALFVTQFAAAGDAARKRFIHEIARSDAIGLLEGGWLLPLGQEDAVRPLLATFRALPAQPFALVASNDASRTQPVTIRSWSSDRETWFTFVNDSPWPAIIDLDFAIEQSIALETLGLTESRHQVHFSGGRSPWRIRLAPYDLAIARTGKPNVRIRSWQSQTEQVAEIALRDRLRDVRFRANALREVPPLPAPFEESFESLGDDRRTPRGWIVTVASGATAEMERTQARNGTASLRIFAPEASRGEQPPVRVRSVPLAVPKSGRLALSAWLKTSSAAKQPPFRLVIEAKLDGLPYYRRADVGRAEPGRVPQPLQEDWSPFVFPIDDLPTEGLTDLRIGFDLLGPGEALIDDVQIYDLWFPESQRDALLKSIALADFQLQAGKIADCQTFLDSYWPRFLLRNVSGGTDRMAQLPAPPKFVPSDSNPAANRGGETPPLPQRLPAIPPAEKTAAKPAADAAPAATPPAASPTLMERWKGWFGKSSSR